MELENAAQGTNPNTRDEAIHHLLDNSPYPEVRAAVPNFDEGGCSNTLRAWFIGLLFTTIGSALNALFNLRQPYIVIPSYIGQVLAYPLGKAWEKFIPDRSFNLFGYEIHLNPGPFSKKEHALAVIMANATWGGGAAYGTDIIVALRGFYKTRFGWPFEIFLTITIMMIGFTLGGLFHRFLVTPAAMIWPYNLINTTLFNALHDHSRPDPKITSGWTIGRFQLFLYLVGGYFCYQWLPGYIAPFLSAFAWVTWIKPQNVVINQIFGETTGLSLFPMTFDWSQISGFNFSPLIAPWHAIANTLIGTVFWIWIITPAIHYSGLLYSAYMPISSSGSYDNTGKLYNVSKILTPGMTLDEMNYSKYSPLFLSTTFMLQYGLRFSGIISVIVYASLFHGKDIWSRFRHLGTKADDVHGRLMAKYKAVPQWWYGLLAFFIVPMTFAVTLAYPTQLKWWALLISLFMGAVFILPIGMIAATTNITIGLNVITEFIIGYMQPGKPVGMMLFKSYGYITMTNAQGFLADMKLGKFTSKSRGPCVLCPILMLFLGHYMKIPPRVTFAAQIVAGLWSSLVQVGVTNWALSTITDICEPHQKDHYVCPGGRVFFTASVIWGLIGPARIFSIGQLYAPMMLFWIPGLLLPIAVYIVARTFPHSAIRFFSPPIFFVGTGLIPPATPLNYLSWGIVGYIFQKYLRESRPGWWNYYKNIVSAELDVGLAAATILIFLTLQLTNTAMPSWWGVNLASNTLDALGTAIQAKVPKGQKFGPDKW